MGKATITATTNLSLPRPIFLPPPKSVSKPPSRRHTKTRSKAFGSFCDASCSHCTTAIESSSPPSMLVGSEVKTREKASSSSFSPMWITNALLVGPPNLAPAVEGLQNLEGQVVSMKEERSQKQMKPMRFDFKSDEPFSFSRSSRKRNYAFAKFALCFLALVVVFSIFFSTSISSATTYPSLAVLEEKLPPPSNTPPVPSYFSVNKTQTSQTEECDIFTGRWIPDPSGPYYTNKSCSEIDGYQNCMENGRPDTGYLYWRWKPINCELPRFNPQRFLNYTRSKSLTFIGDSISRNHVQSLLCTLSQVEQAVEVYHDKEHKSKRWHFPSHNFTLSAIWTPLLLKANIIEDISSPEIQLHLDKLDSLWTEQYKNFDYVVISGGKWFMKTTTYYENKKIVGCHDCPGKNLTELGYDHAYRKALQLAFNFITSSKHKVFVIFRTTTPDHFEDGEWFSGGYCNRTTPFKEGEVDYNTVDTTMRNVELEEFEKAVARGEGKEMTLKLLDTTHLSWLRPDGHPGVYRQVQGLAKNRNGKAQNDCLHWCLPGPIDSWNELLMQVLDDA